MYILPTYLVTDKIKLFSSIGFGWADDDSWLENYEFGIPTDINGGVTYGFGFSYIMTDKSSISLGYSKYNYEINVSAGGVTLPYDFEVERTFISFGYSLN